MSDIGAIEPGMWHTWHLFCRMGATSLDHTGTGAACVMAFDRPTASCASGRPVCACARTEAISVSVRRIAGMFIVGILTE
jgi:hypothetical protein